MRLGSMESGRRLVLLALVAGVMFGVFASAAAASYRRACAQPRRGEFECLALVRTDIPAIPRSALAPHTPPVGVGYGPPDLQSAYNLTTASADNGSGQTVAIVDAYDDPNAESDLATYRTAYGLPACTTANGCFKKVNQNGQTSALPAAAGTSGWATEESLDLDMVSAICPNCHILFVEANSATTSNLGTAVNAAVTTGAKYVSNSYGASEGSSDTTYDTDYYDHPGVAVTAAAGDSGWGVSYPAASQYVVSVGGTSLNRLGNARGWTESVWGSAGGGGGTGSGCSAEDPKPSWQTDAGCHMRTDNDVAAVADPNTGVAVYDSYDQSGWGEFGGTSAASPIIAAVYALAGPPAAGSDPASYPYADPSGLYDVTSGANGTCSPAYFCTAETGYDGPTGLGTPNGLSAFHLPQTTPTITWTAPAPITYGTPLSGAQLDATASVPGNFTYSPAAGTVLDAGQNQTLEVSFVPNDTTHYTDAAASTTITVNPAPLTVMAPSVTTTYGSPIPGTFTPAYSGFVNGDSAGSLTSQATCTTTATASSPPANYLIMCSGASDPNYSPTYVAGTLTITKAPTTLTAARAKAGLLSITFSATLRTSNSRGSLSGQRVVFSVQGHHMCRATTNSSGVASCSVFPALVITRAPTSYQASFAGAADYRASSAMGRLSSGLSILGLARRARSAAINSAKIVHLTLTRGGVIYARGTGHRKHGVTLIEPKLRHHLLSGSYTLTLSAAGSTQTITRTITLR